MTAKLFSAADEANPVPAISSHEKHPDRYDENGHLKYVVVAVHKGWLDIVEALDWPPLSILDYLLESFRTGTDIQPTLELTFDEHMAELRLLPSVLHQKSVKF